MLNSLAPVKKIINQSQEGYDDKVQIIADDTAEGRGEDLGLLLSYRWNVKSTMIHASNYADSMKVYTEIMLQIYAHVGYLSASQRLPIKDEFHSTDAMLRELGIIADELDVTMEEDYRAHEGPEGEGANEISLMDSAHMYINLIADRIFV